MTVGNKNKSNNSGENNDHTIWACLKTKSEVQAIKIADQNNKKCRGGTATHILLYYIH